MIKNKFVILLIIILCFFTGCSKSKEEKTICYASTEDAIKRNLDMIVSSSDLTSSNPYDYTKNEHYNNIVNLGEDAVPVLENMYKEGKLTGVNAYISALAIQDITKCDLYKEYNLDWSTADEFYSLWEDNNCSFKK